MFFRKFKRKIESWIETMGKDIARLRQENGDLSVRVQNLDCEVEQALQEIARLQDILTPEVTAALESTEDNSVLFTVSVSNEDLLKYCSESAIAEEVKNAVLEALE